MEARHNRRNQIRVKNRGGGMGMNYPGEEEQEKLFRSQKEYEGLRKIQVVQPRSVYKVSEAT